MYEPPREEPGEDSMAAITLKAGQEKRCAKRRGMPFRGPIDKCASHNVHTLESTDPGRDSSPLPPGRLEELLEVQSRFGATVYCVQGHRWRFTGWLAGQVLAGAKKQGHPSGLRIAFAATWDKRGFQSQVILLVGRIQLQRYWRPTERADHVVINV